MKTLVAEKFWSRVAITESNECWPWTGGKRLGYGRLRIGEQMLTAHRVAFELTSGTIPDGLIVRHTCDNPSCCNPRHLLTGTQADNVHDAVVRNRAQRGERNGITKLTDQDVVAIRNEYQGYDRKRSLSVIAKKYNISREATRRIIIRETWKHVA